MTDVDCQSMHLPLFHQIEAQENAVTHTRGHGCRSSQSHGARIATESGENVAANNLATLRHVTNFLEA